MFLGMIACQIMDKTVGQRTVDIGMEQIQMLVNPTVGLDVALEATILLIVQVDLEDSATFAENLYCAFSCPNWYFLLLFCFSFVYCLITSKQRLEAQAQGRRLVENLEGVMWFHIGTAVVPGKLPSEQVSRYC